MQGFGLTFGLLVVPLFLGSRIDRAIGHRLAEGSSARRLLVGIFSLYGRLGFGRGRNPTLALVASHAGPLRMGLTIGSVMLLAVLAVVTSYHAQRHPASLGGYALFPSLPTHADRTRVAAFYEDTRNPDRDAAMPHIQSAISEGPYLQLVVPYQPASDNQRLRTMCAGAAANAATQRAVATLACLQRIHAIFLDGQALPAQAYDIGSDPRTDRPALVTMIDVRALAPGRHELTVAHAAAPDDEDPEAALAYRIPFWRLGSP